MYDSVNPLQIAPNVEAVAGYVDGMYAWSAADWARFPNAYKVRIAVFAKTDDGHVLDVEPGCSTPAQAPGWIKKRQAAGIARPWVYCNLSTIAAVRASCAGLQWDWWAAHYTQQPHVYPGSVATQYADPGPVDISLVDPGALAALLGATPKPQGDEDMSYFMVPDSNPEGIIWLCRDLAMGPKRRVFNPAEGTAYAAVMTDKTTHTIPRFVFDAMPIETVAAIQPAVADVKAAVSAIQSGTPVAHTHPITANTGDPYK